MSLLLVYQIDCIVLTRVLPPFLLCQHRGVTQRLLGLLVVRTTRRPFVFPWPVYSGLRATGDGARAARSSQIIQWISTRRRATRGASMIVTRVRGAWRKLEWTTMAPLSVSLLTGSSQCMLPSRDALWGNRVTESHCCRLPIKDFTLHAHT